MKEIVLKTAKIVAVLSIVGLILAGCGAKTGGTAAQVDRSDWEWVPRVWVEDNSFAGRQYQRCIFDERTFGYLCPPGTR